MRQQPRHGFPALLLGMALAASGCVINVDADQVVVRDQKHFKAGAGADITLDTFDGSIKVMSWDQSDVQVEIEKRGPDTETAESLEVRSSQQGDRIRVEAPAPRVQREVIGINVSSPSVSFIVHLPKNAKLTAITRDGSIVVENITGTVNLRSGDGSIRADHLDGDITARTDDGSVSITNVKGRVSLETGDGSVRVAGRVQDLQAKTGDGSIVIEADDGSAMQRNWDISTGDGSISLRLPQNFSAEIDAESRDGSVRSEFESLHRTNDEDDDRGTLRGRIGSGGHMLTLRSGDGSIAVLHR